MEIVTVTANITAALAILWQLMKVKWTYRVDKSKLCLARFTLTPVNS